jgi:hypothetical protein
MFRKHNHFKEDYLLKTEKGLVQFQKITKTEIESSNPLAFCYFENSGQVTNDILSGITFETNQTAFVSEQDHSSFMGSLAKAPNIFDEELIMLLPLSVHPKFEAPF